MIAGVIIAHNYEIAKNCALIDWGWTMHDRSRGLFKNLAGEEIKYNSSRHPEHLRGLQKGLKLYIVEYGLLQSDIDRLSREIAGRFEVVRGYGRGGRV